MTERVALSLFLFVTLSRSKGAPLSKPPEAPAPPKQFPLL
jgi:hypothetical protein